MGRLWALVYLTVPIFGVGVFALGPTIKVWLPPDHSAHGHAIDHLYYFILWLTGIVFVATELVLFWFLWKYEAGSNPRPVRYVHGNHSLEIVWSVLPAATLLFIAVYQMNAWADSKMREPKIPPTLEVSARQFEWRLRYPGRDNRLGSADDLYTVNDLHIPVNEEILIELKSQDVLHSLFIPEMRIKQDAVPGMRIPVWFRAMEVGQYDIPCAELCGWGHYKMKGRLTVESRADFDAWLAALEAEQTAFAPPAPASADKDSP